MTKSNTSAIFNEMDHRLSVIRRWNILHTIQEQNLATHIFNVERIAIRIAKEWFGHDDPAFLWDVIRWAHHHDDFEALSGDFPTMVKPYFDEDAFEEDHSDIIKRREPSSKSVKGIVKLADQLEMYNFLSMEVKLGNLFVVQHKKSMYSEIMSTVRAYWPESFFADLGVRVQEYIEYIDGMVSTRYSRRGR